MPPTDQPPGADSRRTSEERHLLAGCAALTIGPMLVLIVATLAFKPTANTYLVGGGAILAWLVLAIVLNQYAPSPKPQRARRIEDEGLGWASWQVVFIAINLAILWHIFDETNRQGWDIGHSISLLTILGLMALGASSLIYWVKAQRARRNRSIPAQEDHDHAARQ